MFQPVGLDVTEMDHPPADVRITIGANAEC